MNKFLLQSALVRGFLYFIWYNWFIWLNFRNDSLFLGFKLNLKFLLLGFFGWCLCRLLVCFLSSSQIVKEFAFFIIWNGAIRKSSHLWSNRADRAVSWLRDNVFQKIISFLLVKISLQLRECLVIQNDVSQLSL